MSMDGSMTPRERILAVLNHQKSDRVPFDIWYTPEVRDQLMAYFHVNEEIELWRLLRIDKIVMVDAPYTDVSASRMDDQGRTLACNEWGSGIRTVRHGSGGSYEEVVTYPLAEARTIDDIARHRWPDPDLFAYDVLNTQCMRHRNSVCMLTFISLFEIYCKLRPMDQSLIDLYVEPEISDAIIERILSVHKEYIERAFAVCGDALDIVYLSDDMGMQDRQLIGTDVWEARFAKPYQELIDLVHAHDAKAFYHTDGAAFPIIERMVGMGVDVINPIQHSCPGMDREHLASALQGRVVFHGAVDTQQVLPFGTAAEVTTEVRRNIEALGGAGGYICAPCHNLQPGVPLENILALYAADRSW